MKKITLVLLFIIALAGCSFISERKQDWEACKKDPICYESAKKWQETGGLIGGLAGSAIPGAAIPVQKGVEYLALGLAMLIGGHALRKKEIPSG